MRNVLDDNQIELLRKSGKILRDALSLVEKSVRPGVSTKFLDSVADNYIIKMGGTPSFKNYLVEGVGRYPSALCISINDEIVHGLPDDKRIIKEGDLISLDLGVDYKGICSDMARTIYVGTPPLEIQKFLDITEQCLEEGIKAARVGNRIGAIGHSVQTLAEINGYGVVRDLVGHGIGTKPHMEPMIPNYGDNDEGPQISEHMALAIEPMLTIGKYDIKVEKNGWTISTADQSLACHFEHTIVIIDGEPVVVTR